MIGTVTTTDGQKYALERTGWNGPDKTVVNYLNDHYRPNPKRRPAYPGLIGGASEVIEAAELFGGKPEITPAAPLPPDAVN